MIARLLLLALVMMTVCAPVAAHDIGVTQVELIELGDNSYQLAARVGEGGASLHPTLELPPFCGFTESPRGVQTATLRVWAFDCEDRLTADENIVLPWRRDGVMVSAEWQDGASGKRLFGSENGRITVALGELQAGSSSLADAAGRYLILGVEHILEGFDHLLFVLGLLLIVSVPPLRVMTLIKTITAFTLAHSLTLGLATLGLVNVPGPPVEAAIALSIVYLAVEVLRGWEGRLSLSHHQPWLIAFGFGLLHGLGFAGALSDIGLPQTEIPVALLFFNVGVEVGQLLFVAVVLGAQTLLLRSPIRWPRKAAYAPVYLMGTVGAYWMIERVVNMAAPV